VCEPEEAEGDGRPAGGRWMKGIAAWLQKGGSQTAAPVNPQITYPFERQMS